MTSRSSVSVSSELVARNNLDATDRKAMYALLHAHFDGVSREQFEHDLVEKNWVLLLRQSESLVGFSTLLLRQSAFEGTAIAVVYSGDTIVAPSAWGSAALPREWIAAVMRIRQQFPNLPLYWLLLTSGFRTYRLLPTFWRMFYPRFDVPTPPHRQQLLDQLAIEQYGDYFDRAGGIVRLPSPQRLRQHLAGIPPSRANDPNVAFFVRRNPGHNAGEELVCLCELSEPNLTTAGRRMVFGPQHRTRS